MGYSAPGFVNLKSGGACPQSSFFPGVFVNRMKMPAALRCVRMDEVCGSILCYFDLISLFAVCFCEEICVFFLKRD